MSGAAVYCVRRYLYVREFAKQTRQIDEDIEVKTGNINVYVEFGIDNAKI